MDNFSFICILRLPYFFFIPFQNKMKTLAKYIITRFYFTWFHHKTNSPYSKHFNSTTTTNSKIKHWNLALIDSIFCIIKKLGYFSQKDIFSFHCQPYLWVFDSFITFVKKKYKHARFQWFILLFVVVVELKCLLYGLLVLWWNQVKKNRVIMNFARLI
jgi:hypothetical protein